MRFRLIALRAASTVTILGTALATALIAAPAQASRSAADAGHPGSHSSGAPAPLGPFRISTAVITGVVDGAGGRPLTGACVMATGPSGSVLAVTRSGGRYILSGLQAGGYTLHYSSCAAGGDYVDEWSGGSSWPASASTVTIARGQARELAPVTLRTTQSASGAAIPRSVAGLVSGLGTSAGVAPLRPDVLTAKASGSASGAGRGAIAGTVTGGGKPLEGVCAIAVGPGFSQTRTSAAGHYRITKLRPGRYYVYFIPSFYCGRNHGNWLPQVYKGINGPGYRGKRTRVQVTAGQTTNGIDAALELGGEISGIVRSESGKIVPRVCVLAQGHSRRFYFEINGISGKNGKYDLHSLFPGKYQVAFLPTFCGSRGNYIAQWWRDSQTQKHATTIVITSGEVVRDVDAALHPGAIIRGVVRAAGPHGARLKGICVSAQPVHPVFPYPYEFAVTARDGSYRLAGLTTGKYRLFFSRGCGNHGNYLGVHLTVSVVAGHVSSGIDAFLPPGAIITGTVTNSKGTPIRGVCVEANGRGYGAATTKANGTYSIIALQSGNYALAFSGGCGNAGSYAPQYYRGQVNIASASPVAATAGHTTPGVNATMQPGGTVTGVVTNASGKRLNNICVQVQSPSQKQFGYPFYFQFTRHGVFTASNLVPGLYAVSIGCFFGGLPRGLAGQWFMGKADSGTANFVSAPAGVTARTNVVLRPGGFISGVLRNSAGKPLGAMCVRAIPHGSQFSGRDYFLNRSSFAFTNSRGQYRIGPLVGARYDVQFDCFQQRYAPQWYRGSAHRASATPVSVANGSTTTGIDGSVSAGGSISGQVTTGANKPQPDVCVEARDTADQSFGYGYTNRHGRYSIGSLSTGMYQVTFYDCGYGRHHVPLGSASFPRGVKVVAPQAVTGVDVKMFPAGSISGTVRGGSGATLQAGVCVVADPVSPSANYQTADTGRRGTFRMDGLAPGKYQIYFGDPFCPFDGSGYAPQWYKGQASQGAATEVTVSSSQVTAGINATLGTDGAISGTVTSQRHMPVSGECVTATPVAPAPDPLIDTVLNPVIGMTAADGTYSLVGLLPGRYTVEFSVGCGDRGFITQWWHDAASAGAATAITVSANGTVTAIDAHLHGHG